MNFPESLTPISHRNTKPGGGGRSDIEAPIGGSGGGDTAREEAPDLKEQKIFLNRSRETEEKERQNWMR